MQFLGPETRYRKNEKALLLLLLLLLLLNGVM
jgi:hypothetical protein